ncbi:MAG TPA: thioesterase family protein [Parvibaculum sp.]
MGEMIDVARSSVQTWQTDQMGHMNVQFYPEFATQGLAALGVYLGLGPRYIDAERARLIARDCHMRFLREQRPGAPFTVRAGIVDATDFGLRVYMEMRNTISDELSATFTADVELMDEDTHEARPLTIRAKKAVKAIKIDLPAHGAPRGLQMLPPRKPPTLKEAEEMKLVFTWQGEVQTEQCDRQGFLAMRHFVGIISDSIPNLIGQTRGDDRSKTPTIGGAALEYRFYCHRHPRAGDVLRVMSGLKELGPKTYVWCHMLFDVEKGDCVGTAEAVAITLDLETRKAVPIADETRAKLEGLMVAGLGV